MTANTRPIKVFYSYSRKDKKLRDKLETCLSTLQQGGFIQEWHDGCIQPGQEWETLIYQQLAAADLVLLLISPDFIQSKFCYRVEMEQALKRHEAGQACVIPIILRPTDWEESPFSKLQCLPKDGKPVVEWRSQDKAFLDIAKGIRQAIKERHPEPFHTTPSLISPKPALRKAYLNLMVESWHTLPLDVLDPSTADPAARRLTLDQVYVSLDTSTRRPDKLKKNKPEWEEDKPLSVVEALCHAERQRLVLLGQPGSGKSTFGRHLALTLAQSLRKKLQIPLGQQLPGWKGKARLPVLIPLRHLAASVSPEQQGTVNQVTDFIRRQVDERAALAGFGEPLVQELQTQGGLVIFDGLDEVVGERRLAIKQAVTEFAGIYERCWLLVTCRVHSYYQDPTWQLPWETHTLADFNSEKIQQFMTAWYGALTTLNPDNRIPYQHKVETLKQALDPDDPRGLRDLAGTPLLLTVMVIVHTHKELPYNRVGVYRECVDILLMRWQAAREGDARRIPLLTALVPYQATPQKIHQGLREIAYLAHQSGEHTRQSGGRALVSDVIISGVMKKWLGTQGLEVFLDYCRHTNGLLLVDRIIEQAEGMTVPLYVFPHLTFEEYLAALYLLQQPEGSVKEAVDRAGDPAWWEVIRFYGECLCHDERDAKPYLAKVLLEKLCPGTAPMRDQDWRRIWLAGALLPGWWQEVPEDDRDTALKERAIDRLVGLIQTQGALRQDALARAATGRVLANLGDPRPGVRLGRDDLPDFQWVRIPGTAAVRTSGRFPHFTELRLGGARPDLKEPTDRTWWLGKEDWPADTKPSDITDFELAIYPVTVAQFRPFVMRAYREDRWWSEAGRRDRGERAQPYLWDDPAWTLDNHPIVGVTWYDAEAYCNWLNEQLQLPRGTIRLPTEAEWEWAARGPEGRRYPWGDDWESWRCNSEESGINRTSAVGCFPGGAADWWRMLQPGSGVIHDLAGNVWEWAASEYSEYSKDYSKVYQSVLNTDHPDDSPCVLRGGSWDSVPFGVRGAARATSPLPWYTTRGFRLAGTFPSIL